jgi:hypothetical protein
LQELRWLACLLEGLKRSGSNETRILKNNNGRPEGSEYCNETYSSIAKIDSMLKLLFANNQAFEAHFSWCIHFIKETSTSY